MPFSKQTIERFADTVLELCETGVLNLLDAVFGPENADVHSKYIEVLYVELLVFALHITDRIAFSRYGSEERVEFMVQLMPVVKEKLQSSINSEFQSVYNNRTVFYGSFQKLFADDNESLKGTLFWEFGKAVGTVYSESNPMVVMKLAIFAHSFYAELAEAIDESLIQE